jgi:hypothetical protein
VLEKGNNVKHTPYTTINSLNNIALLLSRPKEHTNALVVIHQYNTDLAILPSPYTLLKSQARHMMRQATFHIFFVFVLINESEALGACGSILIVSVYRPGDRRVRMCGARVGSATPDVRIKLGGR